MARDGSSKKRKKEENTGASTRRQKTSSQSSRPVVVYQEYCELPFTLNTILVDECNFITRKGFDSPNGYDCEPAARVARSVHDLPAKVTVKQVLQHYQRKRGGNKEKDSEKYSEEKKKQVRKFCTGLALLFDDALPVCLLYPEERPQYESLQLDEDLKLKRPSEIYGSTFLLRLLVRLPRLLVAEPQSEMEGEWDV
jgi:MRG